MLTRFLRGLLAGTPARRNVNATDTDYQRALGHLNDGIVARGEGDWKSSLMHLECAVSLAPTLLTARVAFATSLTRTGKTLRALEQCRAASRIDPDDASARAALAAIEEEFRSAARSAIPPRPAASSSDGESIKMALTLPHVLESRTEIAIVREQLEQDLDRLSRANLTVKDPATEVGLTAFYLVYHGENDRKFQEKIAALHLKACPGLAWVAPHCAKPHVPEGRIRIGLVSDYFHNHSIGRITEGLIARLDRERFEVHVFGFREPFDDISRAIAGGADNWSVLPRELAAARAKIATHTLDILLYPDVGMDPLTYFMTFARLAPVQCTTWGHPVTTGVPAIDYYVSTEYFEPEDGASHYREQLVKIRDVALPGYYRCPATVAPASPAVLGFDVTQRTYFCPQSLFKIHPDCDALFAEVLRRDPGGELALVADEHADVFHRPRLEARLKRAAPDVFDRIVFLPRTSFDVYLQRLAACHVVLDTIHFCGGNTTLDAISAGALVVTLPTGFARGRAASAFFRKMGFTETVVQTKDAYVELAVRIATDAAYRNRLKSIQSERAGVLWEDESAVDQFEAFFERAVAAVAGR